MDSCRLSDRARVRKRRIWVLETDQGERLAQFPRLKEIKRWWKEYQITERLPPMPLKFRARAKSVVRISRYESLKCRPCGEFHAALAACLCNDCLAKRRARAADMAKGRVKKVKERVSPDQSGTARDQREVASRLNIRTRRYGYANLQKGKE